MQKTSVLHSESIFLSITLFSYNLRKKIVISAIFFGSKLCQNITETLSLTKLPVEELSQLSTHT